MKTIQEVEYTATTGRKFMLREVDWRGNQFWTYEFKRDGRWYGPSVGWSTNQHATRNDAIERVEKEERIRIVGEIIPHGGFVNRDDYEAACSRFGVESMSDDEIRKSFYALRHGDFNLPEYELDHILKVTLARGRMYSLEANTKTRPARQVQEYLPKCMVCGAPADMAASLGPACPDHYDELS